MSIGTQLPDGRTAIALPRGVTLHGLATVLLSIISAVQAFGINPQVKAKLDQIKPVLEKIQQIETQPEPVTPVAPKTTQLVPIPDPRFRDAEPELAEPKPVEPRQQTAVELPPEVPQPGPPSVAAVKDPPVRRPIQLASTNRNLWIGIISDNSGRGKITNILDDPFWGEIDSRHKWEHLDPDEANRKSGTMFASSIRSRTAFPIVVIGDRDSKEWLNPNDLQIPETIGGLKALIEQADRRSGSQIVKPPARAAAATQVGRSMMESTPPTSTPRRSHWTHPDTIANHLRDGHGVNPSGMSQEQMLTLHDNLHEGRAVKQVARPRTVAASDCPDGNCPLPTGRR